MKRLISIVLLAAILFATPVLASSTNSIKSPRGTYIYIGDYYHRIRKIMGHPTDRVNLDRKYSGNFIWVYEPKAYAYTYYLTFRKGKLVKIEYFRR